MEEGPWYFSERTSERTTLFYLAIILLAGMFPFGWFSANKYKINSFSRWDWAFLLLCPSLPW